MRQDIPSHLNRPFLHGQVDLNHGILVFGVGIIFHKAAAKRVVLHVKSIKFVETMDHSEHFVTTSAGK